MQPTTTGIIPSHKNQLDKILMDRAFMNVNAIPKGVIMVPPSSDNGLSKKNVKIPQYLQDKTGDYQIFMRSFDANQKLNTEAQQAVNQVVSNYQQNRSGQNDYLSRIFNPVLVNYNHSYNPALNAIDRQGTNTRYSERHERTQQVYAQKMAETSYAPQINMISPRPSSEYHEQLSQQQQQAQQQIQQYQLAQQKLQQQQLYQKLQQMQYQPPHKNTHKRKKHNITHRTAHN